MGNQPIYLLGDAGCGLLLGVKILAEGRTLLTIVWVLLEWLLLLTSSSLRFDSTRASNC